MSTTGPNLNPIFKQVGVVSKLIQDLESKVSKLTNLHKEILSAPTFENETKDELDNLMLTIKNTSKIIQANLKALKIPNKEEETEDEKMTSARIRCIQHVVLLHNFFDVMNNYQLAQTEYTAKCKARIRRQSNIMGLEISEQEVEVMINEGKWPDFAEGIIATSKDKECKRKLDDVKKRHETFIRLENSLKEVHDLFSEIEFLVESQGTLVNSIQNEVAKSQSYVNQGVVILNDLKEPIIKQKKRRVYIATALFLFVLLLCFIFYLFVR